MSDLVLQSNGRAEIQRAINALSSESGGAGAVQVVVTREVDYAEFDSDGGDGAVVDPFYTIPAGKVLLGIGIQVTEVFNDTFIAGGQIDVNLKVGADVSSNSLADADADSLTPSGSVSGMIRLSNFTYQPFSTAANVLSLLALALTNLQLVLRLPFWNNDGTTGKCRVYIAWADPADAP